MEQVLTMFEATNILHVRQKPGWKTVQHDSHDGSVPCIHVGQSGHKFIESYEDNS